MKFPLIEILVIIGIISLVQGLGIPRMHPGKPSPHYSAKNQCKILANAADTFYLDTEQYPQQLSDLVQQPNNQSAWQGPYMKDGNLPNDPWGNPYRYATSDDDKHSFRIYSYGADNKLGG